MVVGFLWHCGVYVVAHVHARSPDIGAYSQFSWYKPVWYLYPNSDTGLRRKLAVDG
jgi:hypothetical protein